jgi:hypothetical protein
MPSELTELTALWGRLIGNAPSQQQFEIWLASFGYELVKQGILKTAAKNMSLDGQMNPGHRVRFASKCMIVRAQRDVENAANRAAIAEEMGNPNHE